MNKTKKVILDTCICVLDKYDENIWIKIFNILKDGAFSFIITNANQKNFHLISMLNNIGFDIRYTSIYYRTPTELKIILILMKPIKEKSYVDQAIKNKGGITWFDSCRIPFKNSDDLEDYDFNRKGMSERTTLKTGDKFTMDKIYNGGWKVNKKNDYEKYIEKQKSFKNAKSIGTIIPGKTTFLSGNIKVLNPADKYQKKVIKSHYKKTTKRKPREEGTVFKSSGFKSENNDTVDANPIGRFPANLLVSGQALDFGKITISSGGYTKGNLGGFSQRGEAKHPGSNAGGLGDEGDFSRYFDLDLWNEHHGNEENKIVNYLIHLVSTENDTVLLYNIKNTFKTLRRNFKEL